MDSNVTVGAATLLGFVWGILNHGWSLMLLVAVAIPTAVTVTTIVLYRVLLHPLAQIPGPKLAAATYWYEIYFNIAKPGMFIWEIQRLHGIYGPVIRINPKEVHVAESEYLDEIYSTSRPRNKFTGGRGQNWPNSLGGTWDHQKYKTRRAALVPFFSKPAVTRIEPLVVAKRALLCQLFEKKRDTGEPINLSDTFFGLSQDVVKQYGFGYDENLLGNPFVAGKAREGLTTVMRKTHFNMHFSWLNAPMSLLPRSVLLKMSPGLEKFMQYRKKVSDQVVDVLARNRETSEVASEDVHRTIFAELRDTELLPPEDRSLSRLLDEGMLLVAAGSESTAKSLYTIHYHLLANHAIMQKLRAELLIMPSIAKATWNELSRLPYLSAVIEEGNRLNFGLTFRNARIAPLDPMRLGKYTIPPGNPVSTMSLFVNTDESIYPDPWKFDPERWLGPESNERKKYMTSFGKGSRKCIGIHLAYLELYLMVVAMASYDMELFDTDISDVEYRHDFQIMMPKMGSKGIRAVVKDRVEGMPALI